MRKDFILFCFVLFLFSQSDILAQTSENSLHNKWKVVFDEGKYIREMSDAEWEGFKQLSVLERRSIMQKMKKEAEGAVFEFTVDKKFAVYLNGETIESGTWELKPDGKTIIAKNDNGFQDKIVLKRFTANQIIFDSEQYGREVVLVPLQ